MNILSFNKSVRHIYLIHNTNDIKTIFAIIATYLWEEKDNILSMTNEKELPVIDIQTRSKIRRSNSLFIIDGMADFGMYPFDYYKDMLNKMNDILIKHKSYIVIMKSSKSDPSYFDGKKINLSNLKAIPDYTIIKVKGHYMLCIGNSISADRTYQMHKQEMLDEYNNVINCYWGEEKTIFDKGTLNDIIEKDINIDILITNSCPLFIKNEDKSIAKWSKSDETLVDDVKEERTIFDNIYKHLTENDIIPILWTIRLCDECFFETRKINNVTFIGTGNYSFLTDLEEEISMAKENENVNRDTNDLPTFDIIREDLYFSGE